MAFWSDAREGVRDPKRQFRWVLRNNHIPVFTLKKVSKPSFTVQESTHKYINHTYYYPGRVEWNTISMTLADAVDPDGAATMVDIIKQGGYTPATSDLDYDGDDLTDIEIELRYDWAYLETAEDSAAGGGKKFWAPGSGS